MTQLLWLGWVSSSNEGHEGAYDEAIEDKGTPQPPAAEADGGPDQVTNEEILGDLLYPAPPRSVNRATRIKVGR